MVSDCNHNSFNLGIGSTRLPYSIKNSTKRSNQAPHIQKPKQHLKPHPPKTTANNPTGALSTAKQHPKHQAPPHSNQNNIQNSTKTAPKHAPVAPNTSKHHPKQQPVIDSTVASTSLRKQHPHNTPTKTANHGTKPILWEV